MTLVNKIKTVAIVGAGTMGLGIAQVCCMRGYKTLIYDVDPLLKEKAIGSISEGLSLAVIKGKFTKEKRVEALSLLTIAKTTSELKADLIIEAVTENLEVKQKLFLELEEINQGLAILVSNTSSISITQIASVLKNPGQCVGLHFFNPAPLMKLVEVVAGVATYAEVVALTKEFAVSLNKTVVMVKDSPGFIVNRVARHYYVEALKLLEEGVATPEQTDSLLRSAGFKMGPFELMDLIGMNVNFAVTSSLYASFHFDPKFRPSRIQEQKVMAGHLGRKTGKGFYDYYVKK